jgi:LysM domain
LFATGPGARSVTASRDDRQVPLERSHGDRVTGRPMRFLDGQLAIDTNTCSWSDGGVTNMCSTSTAVGRTRTASGHLTAEDSRARVGRPTCPPHHLWRRPPRYTGRPRTAAADGPYTGGGQPAGPVPLTAPGAERVRPPHREPASSNFKSPAARRARLASWIVAASIVVALALPWGGAGGRPLATPGPARAGEQLSPHGLYTVRPGDTLWGIAQRLSPQGDPRPLEAQLESEVGGDRIVVGERLALP